MNTILSVDHSVVNRNNMLIFRFYPHIFRKVRAQNERKTYRQIKDIFTQRTWKIFITLEKDH